MLMQGKLRIGLAEQTLLVSLAQAVLEQRARGKDVPASVLEEGVASVKQASLCTAWCAFQGFIFSPRTVSENHLPPPSCSP